ncbi:hypothetical protein N7463_009253 [Penicillium fimorum]|uniref:Uncharacterized protein n=1 Tax=Penicillium fimorum TaxID=1882269 RepID=A0A9W9XQH2_9EURO|nr:hypothetical protein N7463_009253 [Penicillium fimorum]
MQRWFSPPSTISELISRFFLSVKHGRFFASFSFGVNRRIGSFYAWRLRLILVLFFTFILSSLYWADDEMT